MEQEQKEAQLFKADNPNYNAISQANALTISRYDYVAFSEGKADGRSISLKRQLDKKDKKEITWKKK